MIKAHSLIHLTTGSAAAASILLGAVLAPRLGEHVNLPGPQQLEFAMTTITFDTLKFVERLKAAGVSEEHAKAEVEALAEALNETIAIRALATKSDLESLKADLVKWMAGLLLAQAAVVATLVKLI